MINPLPCQQQGAKVLNRCIENPFASLVLPSIRKFFFAAIGSYDRSDNDRLAAKEMFLISQQKIKIPAKTVVKFRVAKAAKDAVLGVKK